MITIGIIWGNNSTDHQKRKYGLLRVVNYTNSSYTGDFEENKSLSGYCFFFGGAITIWSSKQYQIILTSVSKAKYIVMSHIAKETV